MSKTCPFQFNPLAEHPLRQCNEEGCRIWVKMMKDRILVTGKHSKMADPDSYYVYEGCGLVTAIPWMLVNKVKKQ